MENWYCNVRAPHWDGEPTEDQERNWKCGPLRVAPFRDLHHHLEMAEIVATRGW